MDTVNKPKPTELPKAKIWDYGEFKRRNVGVIQGNEIPFEELPDIIEGGNIGFCLNSLSASTQATLGKNEWISFVGVESDPPYNFVFSKAQQGSSFGMEEVDLSTTGIFSNEASEKIASIGSILHSHPLPIVLSPGDLLPIQVVRKFAPIVGVGTEQFKMLAIRTDRTKLFSGQEERITNPELLKEWMRKEKQRVVTQHYGEYTSIMRPLMWKVTPIITLDSEKQAAINTLYDKIIRAEASERSIAFYIAPYLSNTFHRCDLAKPILGQIPK